MNHPFKSIGKIVNSEKYLAKKARPIRESQVVADELHRMFGWRTKKTLIYGLAAKFKRPRDLYDLAKSEVYSRNMKGDRAYHYLLGIIKLKTK